MKKWIIGFLVFVVVIGGTGFMCRNQLLLEGISLPVKVRMPVGPHQEVDWSKSTAEAGKADRPPT